MKGLGFANAERIVNAMKGNSFWDMIFHIHGYFNLPSVPSVYRLRFLPTPLFLTKFHLTYESLHFATDDTNLHFNHRIEIKLFYHST